MFFNVSPVSTGSAKDSFGRATRASLGLDFSGGSVAQPLKASAKMVRYSFMSLAKIESTVCVGGAPYATSIPRTACGLFAGAEMCSACRKALDYDYGYREEHHGGVSVNVIPVVACFGRLIDRGVFEPLDLFSFT
jgi:hypothetical protein